MHEIILYIKFSKRIILWTMHDVSHYIILIRSSYFVNLKIKKQASCSA